MCTFKRPFQENVVSWVIRINKFKMADTLGGSFEDFLKWSLGELQKYFKVRGN